MTTTASVAAGTWTVDLAHTRAAFTARHFFGQPVHGTITVTAATIEVGEDGHPQRFQATLDPASIGTGHARRDADLRGKRFLAVAAYPLMEVVADRIAATADGWCADAVLRARGREAALRIDATLDGVATEPELRLTRDQPKGVLQKNLKTFVYLGAALLVIVAAFFSSSGKKTPSQQAAKGQPPPHARSDRPLRCSRRACPRRT